MSWRRQTCRDDGSCGRTGVVRAEKAAEQSAERFVSRPSTCRGDDERVVKMAEFLPKWQMKRESFISTLVSVKLCRRDEFIDGVHSTTIP